MRGARDGAEVRKKVFLGEGRRAASCRASSSPPPPPPPPPPAWDLREVWRSRTAAATRTRASAAALASRTAAAAEWRAAWASMRARVRWVSAISSLASAAAARAAAPRATAPAARAAHTHGASGISFCNEPYSAPYTPLPPPCGGERESEKDEESDDSRRGRRVKSDLRVAPTRLPRTRHSQRRSGRISKPPDTPNPPPFKHAGDPTA